MSSILRRTIIGDAQPENVILLEIEPEKQKTRIDFAATETILGIRSVCLTKLEKRAGNCFTNATGARCAIERIYNRVIFDELIRRPDLNLPFRFQDDLDVKWVGHPNWYFRISKHSLPFLKTEHTSPAFFADEFPRGREDRRLRPEAALFLRRARRRHGTDAGKTVGAGEAARMDPAKESSVCGIRADHRTARNQKRKSG